jgi:hypothetical protein
LVNNTNPRFGPFSPTYLTLYFVANDGVHGNEPWVLGPVPVTASASAIVMSSAVDLALDQALNAAGQATFSTAALAAGTHDITATYGGDGNFTTSVSAIIAEVVKSSAGDVASVPMVGAANGDWLGLIDWSDGYSAPRTPTSSRWRSKSAGSWYTR